MVLWFRYAFRSHVLLVVTLWRALFDVVVMDCGVPPCCLFGVLVDCLWLVFWNSMGMRLLRHAARHQ